MRDTKHQIPAERPNALFERVVSILEQARGNVARTVNTSMVLAYWLIGREIVQELQGGEDRADYGKQVLEGLSRRLNECYGKGFSVSNLQNFRKFYLAYHSRIAVAPEIQYPMGTKSVESPIPCPAGSEELLQGFSPQLSWSHYRALMRVENATARAFYEREAIECGWSKTQLERQIHSFCYDRIVANRSARGLPPEDRARLPGETVSPGHLLKSPMVLEFLGLPDPPELHESKLEQAIIENLQSFLLERGKGFSFVARQKHVRFDDDDFYIDLVFYNYVLKCFLLIDLKMGKLTHADIGQMDGYVRLYEDLFKVPGDNPTVGLLLCADKGEAVAKYSILNENRQIFASKYLPHLPSEEELRIEIEREHRLIEEVLRERKALTEGETSNA